MLCSYVNLSTHTSKPTASFWSPPQCSSPIQSCEKHHTVICSQGLQSRAHTPILEKTQAPRVLAVPRAKPAVATTVGLEAEQKLAELYSQGILEPALLDQHCLGLLARLPKNAQVVALTRMAANIKDPHVKNKRGYVSHLLKRLLSRAGDFDLKLNPCSILYDANLAMCWRVLTKQDKWVWQNRFAKGKQIKLASLSRPRQMLAQQLHQDHSQYHAATAAAWKNTHSAIKEALLQSADQTGEAIKLLPDEQPKPKAAKAPEPEFHETDFPPLGMTTHTQHGPGFSKPMTSGNSSLPGAGVPSQAAGWFTCNRGLHAVHAVLSVCIVGCGCSAAFSSLINCCSGHLSNTQTQCKFWLSIAAQIVCQVSRELHSTLLPARTFLLQKGRPGLVMLIQTAYEEWLISCNNVPQVYLAQHQPSQCMCHKCQINSQLLQ